jgi:Arc/MetJ-type ribon-helix-helix transcriptional regulator
VVSDGLRLLQERAAWQQAKLDALRAEIHKGIDSDDHPALWHTRETR